MRVKRPIGLEFHSNRQVAIAAGLVLGVSGAPWLFISFALPGEGVPGYLLSLGLLSLLLAAICFTFRIVVRMDRRTGRIERSLSTFFWEQTRRYSVLDFRGVGIGMAGGSSGVNMAPRGKYFVQLLGSTNLNIPGMSSNKESVMSLADEVGSYLNLPVDKEPKVAFFQMRL